MLMCHCCWYACAVQIGAAVGLPFPQWYDAGKQADLGNWSFGEQQAAASPQLQQPLTGQSHRKCMLACSCSAGLVALTPACCCTAQHTAHNRASGALAAHSPQSSLLTCCCCRCSLHAAALLCAGTLLFTEAILFHWVETKRGMDLKKPGSQADGSFFGITEEFVPKENGYPGGWQQAASKAPAGRWLPTTRQGTCEGDGRLRGPAERATVTECAATVGRPNTQ